MPRIKNRYFFLVVTDDDMEFPVAVCETTSELSDFLGVSQRQIQYLVCDALTTCPTHLLPTYLVWRGNDVRVYIIPESEV